MSLQQLGALGTSDAFLDLQPTFTVWKTDYQRSTPFAMESVEMQPQGSSLDFSNKASVAIARTGDLLSNVYLQLVFPDLRDYYTALVTATSTQPRIVRAYRVSTSQVSVRVEPPATGVHNVCVVYVSGSPVATGLLAAPYTDITWNATSDQTVTVTAYQVSTPATFAALTMPNVPAAVSTAMSASDVSNARDVLTLRWTDAAGFAVLESVEWAIGGARIDKIPNPEYLDLLSELTTKPGHRNGFNAMVGKYAQWDLVSSSSWGGDRLFVPIPFTFCKSTKAALPIVSLTYNETQINFWFRGYLECIRSSTPISQLVDVAGKPPSLAECKVYCDIVYLSTLERRRFITTPTETLVEQIQYLGETTLGASDVGLTKKIPLDGFNHPIKWLMFVFQAYGKYQRDAVNGNSLFEYSTASGDDPLENISLVLNGQTRFSPQPMSYFYQLQPYQHFTNVPHKKVCVYSFAADPEDPVRPTGTCNFARLEHAALYAKVTPALDPQGGRVKVYGLAWNVLRIAEGSARLAFAN